MKKFIVSLIKKIPFYKLIYLLINRFISFRFCNYYSNNITNKFFSNHHHIFGGYYDINILNSSNNKLLAHRTKLLSVNSCEIGYYEMSNPDNFIKIEDTFAWCWQQGSRLRWIDGKNIISYNSVRNGKYVNVFKSISDYSEVLISMPLYDISNDATNGLSLNFARLGRLRSGYGYDLINDKSINERIPKNDGVFLVNIPENKSKLLISFEELNQLFPIEESFFEYDQYINHLSFNPSGNKFIFYHILSKDKHRKIRVFYYDLDIKKIHLIEDKFTISHYCWRNNSQLLLTIVGKKTYYSIYDICSGNYISDIDNLNLDGHPTFMNSKNIFVSDTYPDKSNFQNLFVYDLGINKKKVIGSFYKRYRYQEEKRCDLHPRLSDNLKLVSIDSTHDGNRAIYILKI